MKICSVQHRPVAGDIATNVARHLEFIELASDQSADLVFFPELSLTGYEPSLAKSLATDKTDRRLDVFQQRSDASNMIIGVGLPLSAGSAVKIGMVWFTPHGPRRDYAKQQLHDDELPFFVPGDGQILLKVAAHTLAPAICYESLQPKHAEDAASLGADIYLASVAKPARGMARAVQHFPVIARKHNLHVIMADCVGPSDNFVSVGQSAVWNNRGELLNQLDSESEGLVLFDTASGQALSSGVDWQRQLCRFQTDWAQEVASWARSLAETRVWCGYNEDAPLSPRAFKSGIRTRMSRRSSFFQALLRSPTVSSGWTAPAMKLSLRA